MESTDNLVTYWSSFLTSSDFSKNHSSSGPPEFQEDSETKLPPTRVATQADSILCEDVSMAEEQTLQDEPMNGDVSTDDTVTYSVIENLSQRGKPKLLDSRGFSYTVRVRKAHVTYWRCTVRNRKHMCGASVVQRGDDFKPGPFMHSHQAKPNSHSVAKMIVNIKSKASEDMSKPASSIVREVYRETFGNDISESTPGMPKEANLARQAKRLRQRMRSEDPSYEDFHPDGTRSSDQDDPDSAPSMVFNYRIRPGKLKKKKKGTGKRKKKPDKGKAKKHPDGDTNTVPSSTATTEIVVVGDVPPPSSQHRSSESAVLSDVAKATCLKEIAALIAERDAALKRVEEIEQELFRKYQIPVLDCRY